MQYYGETFGEDKICSAHDILNGIEQEKVTKLFSDEKEKNKN